MDLVIANAGRRFLNRLDAAADWWLGSALPPPERAIRDSDWEADPRDAYCPRCGDSTGPGEATETGCGSCRGKPAIADGFIRLGSYAGDLRGWILQIKYRQRWFEMGRCLGNMLGEAVIDAAVTDPNRLIIVPMPMPWRRRLYRGIDHARLIASAAAKRLDSPLEIMLRQMNGRPQVSLPASRRIRRGARRMSISRRFRDHHLAGRDLLLIDDVRTTGATLKAGARLLRKLKPDRIIAAVLSVSDDAARRSRILTSGLAPGMAINATAASASGSADPSLLDSAAAARRDPIAAADSSVILN